MSLLGNEKDGSLIKGIVVSEYQSDPLSLKRVQIYIPAVHGKFDSGKVGINSSAGEGHEVDGMYPWAQCMVQSGLSSMPKAGSTVWIVFETNDTRLPVVIGLHTAALQEESLDATQGTGLSGGSLAEIAAQIIFSNEGGYESVNWNDNGAISIGKIQWHANRARNLLKKMREKNPSKFDSIDGGSGVTSSLNNDWSHWKNWSASCSAGKALKSILATDESHKAQDEQAISDVQGYLNTAKSGGITDPGCLIYLADIINQYGSCSGLVKSGINNLDQLHKYALSNGYSKYARRRNATYQAIKQAEQQGKLTENGLVAMSGATGGKYLWPVPYTKNITSGYGSRTDPVTGRAGAFHSGIDISAWNKNSIKYGSNDTRIIASHDGVIHFKCTSGGYGNLAYVVGNGVCTYYAHQYKFYPGISDGAQVKQGQYIGYVGTTGNSTGPHLHFEIRNAYGGTTRNPTPELS